MKPLFYKNKIKDEYEEISVEKGISMILNAENPPKGDPSV
jgi:hypothetical protein